MKVGKLAKNREKGQNCYPLSPDEDEDAVLEAFNEAPRPRPPPRESLPTPSALRHHVPRRGCSRATSCAWRRSNSCSVGTSVTLQIEQSTHLSTSRATREPILNSHRGMCWRQISETRPITLFGCKMYIVWVYSLESFT